MNNVRGVSFHVEQQNDDILRQALTSYQRSNADTT